MQTEIYSTTNNVKSAIVVDAQINTNAVTDKNISADEHAHPATDVETPKSNPTSLEDKLISLALTDEKVLGARCVLVDNAYIIAIITTPFYLKSERDEWCDDMQNMLATTTNSVVHLSLDLDIYRNIRQDMTDEDKTELLESVLSRKATLY